MEFNEQNDINSHDKNDKNGNNRLRKIINIIFIVSLTIHILSYTVFPNLTISEDIPEATETVVQETSPPVLNEMVGHMEFVGCARNAVVASPVTFYYYRDIVTDQMFLVSCNTNNHTVTQMTHPDTGLPLTYSEYQSMKNFN